MVTGNVAGITPGVYEYHGATQRLLATLERCSVVAFYDAEATELIGVDPSQRWVIHFAWLGTKG